MKTYAVIKHHFHDERRTAISQFLEFEIRVYAYKTPNRFIACWRPPGGFLKNSGYGESCEQVEIKALQEIEDYLNALFAS